MLLSVSIPQTLGVLFGTDLQGLKRVKTSKDTTGKYGRYKIKFLRYSENPN